MDLARISGIKVEELKNFLQLRGLRTYEEVDLSPQNSFQSPECTVHRSGVFGYLALKKFWKSFGHQCKEVCTSLVYRRRGKALRVRVSCAEGLWFESDARPLLTAHSLFTQQQH